MEDECKCFLCQMMENNPPTKRWRDHTEEEKKAEWAKWNYVCNELKAFIEKVDDYIRKDRKDGT